MNTFFIAGAQRSGTTLLSVILDRHPDIHIGSDSVGFRLISCFNLYRDVLPYNLTYNWEEIQSWLIENDYKGRLVDLLDYKNIGHYPDAKSLVRQGIEKRLELSGKRIFGDKSPNIEHYMRDILTLLPNAKFVHLVRDGRATTLSRHTRAHKNLYLGAQEWMDSNITGLSNQALVGKDTYKIIKYEDLLINPKQTITDLCEFLKISFDSAMILKNEDVNDEKLYVKNVLDLSKIDSFKTQLTNKQIKKIEKIQGPLLTRFNYDLVCQSKENTYRELPVFSRIWFNQMDNFKQLFISKRIGMVSRKNVEVNISLGVRIKNFVFEIGKDFLPDRVFRRLFRRRWIRNVYFNKN